MREKKIEIHKERQFSHVKGIFSSMLHMDPSFSFCTRTRDTSLASNTKCFTWQVFLSWRVRGPCAAQSITNQSMLIIHSKGTAVITGVEIFGYLLWNWTDSAGLPNHPSFVSSSVNRSCCSDGEFGHGFSYALAWYRFDFIEYGDRDDNKSTAN